MMSPPTRVSSSKQARLSSREAQSICGEGEQAHVPGKITEGPRETGRHHLPTAHELPTSLSPNEEMEARGPAASEPGRFALSSPNIRGSAWIVLLEIITQCIY